MLHRIIRWRSLAWPGYEHCEVHESADGVLVRSVLAGERDGHQYGAHYEIGLDPGWVFRGLRLERTDGEVLLLNADGRGHWTDGEHRRLPQLDGCLDIDLSGSPLTNTLPIRRAGLVPGTPQRLRMAWIPLDLLKPRPEEQVYTKLDERRFLYESGDGTFRAELETDDAGLIVRYPGLFEQL